MKFRRGEIHEENPKGRIPDERTKERMPKVEILYGGIPKFKDSKMRRLQRKKTKWGDAKGGSLDPVGGKADITRSNYS